MEQHCDQCGELFVDDEPAPSCETHQVAQEDPDVGWSIGFAGEADDVFFAALALIERGWTVQVVLDSGEQFDARWGKFVFRTLEVFPFTRNGLAGRRKRVVSAS